MEEDKGGRFATHEEQRRAPIGQSSLVQLQLLLPSPHRSQPIPERTCLVPPAPVKGKLHLLTAGGLIGVYRPNALRQLPILMVNAYFLGSGCS